MAQRLTREQARRLAVRAALLDDGAASERDLVDVVGALAMLRVELTSLVAPAADHVAWSRLGDGYRLGDADRALAAGRLWERGWMLRPLAQLPLFLATMRTWLERSGSSGWVEANEPFRRGILDRLRDAGPLTSRDIPDEAVVPWPSSGWTNGQNVTKMLECLHMAGDLAVVGRAGKLRLWDVAENVLPSAEALTVDEAHRVRSDQLMAAFGIRRDATGIVPYELHNLDRVGVPVEIEGVAGRWLADPAQLEDAEAGDGFRPRTAILSPFDRLLSDKARVERLFEFDYTLEMYKPDRTRRWGAFALPILHGDRLVGKIDGRSERDAGEFRIRRVHEDVSFDRRMRADIDEEISRFTAWMRLRPVRDAAPAAAGPTPRTD